MQKKISLRAKRRSFRVRKQLMSRGLKPRIAIFRSLNHIYAQIIDDSAQATLVSHSSLNMKKVGNKKDFAKQVGLELGKKAVESGIKEVFFDRGNFLYHGRVRALAEGLREGGLNF